MDYTHLGRTGLSVSRAVLGTMNFGPETSEDDSHAIMDRAHELGVNFFDTANGYGGSVGKGATEEIIGRWFAKGGGRREKTVLATKVYGEMIDWPNGGKLSAYNIRQSLDASLRRLQTDHVDLFQMHHVDRDTPWDEIWQAMELAVAQGKVLYVGSSNFAGAHRPGPGSARGTATSSGSSASSRSTTSSSATSSARSSRPPGTTASGSSRGPRCRAGCSAASSRRPSRVPVAERPQRRVRRGTPRPAVAYESFAKELGHTPGARPRVAAAPAGRHRPDHRPAHDGAVGVRRPRDRHPPRRRGAGAARRAVPGHKTSPEDFAW